MKAARAFSALALIVGGVLLVANLVSSCLSPLRDVPRIEAPAFLLSGAFQGLSLLLLRSSLCTDNALVRRLQSDAADLGNAGIDFPETCAPSAAARCAVAATAFWALAAFASSTG